MSLTIYNNYSKQREQLEPMEPDHIKMYACGVTVYDVCHIGHGMQAIIYDVIRNYLQYRGYKVTYVRNYTDVDDKIIAKAAELGIPALEHSQNIIEATERDLALLGVADADIQPKVSDHIPEIIALIERLIDQDKAYAADGDVYFKVTSFDRYGKLSNRDPENMREVSSLEPGSKKKDALDFALWKSAKAGEVSWPSPWGDGRPGWHIECSALAMKYLGETFDIHGGGKDLIFPHHENEIAQSEMATGKTFAKHWIHNGLLTVDGVKMSKSLGNFLTIQDAVAKYFPETIRFTILSHHYSSNIDFSEKSFYDAYSRVLYFYNTLNQVDNLTAAQAGYPESLPDGVELPDVKGAFTAAMDTDFNTTAAIREIGLGFKWINEFLAAKKPKQKMKIHAVATVAAEIREVAATLGLLQMKPQEAIAGIQKYLVRDKGIDPDAVEAKLVERREARENKDFAKADTIRDDLIQQGINVMDTPQGTTWQVEP